MPGIYTLLEGKRLCGRYHIASLLGKGGMGAVFRATDLHLDREVAVKVVSVDGLSPEEEERCRARFRREAKAAARLRHPNVVGVYDYGTDPELGLDFLVMELLEGEDLDRRLKRVDRLPHVVAVDFLVQAAEGLAAGHRANLVHRDVKPANLFLERVGPEVRVRVLDFGIAELGGAGGTMTQLTQFGRTPLSPAFASPEQHRGDHPLTPATDVFSLAVTAYRMLTGTLPFSSAQIEALSRGERITPVPPRTCCPGLPDHVERAILTALAADPEERFPDAGAFGEALRAGTDAPFETDDADDQETFEPDATADGYVAAASTEPASGASPWPWIAVAVIAFLLVAAVATMPRGDAAGAEGEAVSLMTGSAPAPSYGPSVTPAAQDNSPWVERAIQTIRERYNTIQGQLPSYFCREREIEGYSAEGGTIRACFDGASLRKITARHYGESGRVTEEYFYWESDEPFFVFRISARYTEPLSGVVASRSEDRFYFDGGRLIRWRDDARNLVPLAGDAAREEERSLLEDGRTFARLARGQ